MFRHLSMRFLLVLALTEKTASYFSTIFAHSLPNSATPAINAAFSSSDHIVPKLCADEGLSPFSVLAD